MQRRRRRKTSTPAIPPNQTRTLSVTMIRTLMPAAALTRTLVRTSKWRRRRRWRTRRRQKRRARASLASCAVRTRSLFAHRTRTHSCVMLYFCAPPLVSPFSLYLLFPPPEDSSRTHPGSIGADSQCHPVRRDGERILWGVASGDSGYSWADYSHAEFAQAWHTPLNAVFGMRTWTCCQSPHDAPGCDPPRQVSQRERRRISSWATRLGRLTPVDISNTGVKYTVSSFMNSSSSRLLTLTAEKPTTDWISDSGQARIHFRFGFVFVACVCFIYCLRLSLYSRCVMDCTQGPHSVVFHFSEPTFITHVDVIVDSGGAYTSNRPTAFELLIDAPAAPAADAARGGGARLAGRL